MDLITHYFGKALLFAFIILPILCGEEVPRIIPKSLFVKMNNEMINSCDVQSTNRNITTYKLARPCKISKIT